MGWASFLGGLAADAARDYVNKRGIDGVMEDAGNIASGVKNYFSNSSSISWDDITTHVSELVEAGQYVQALDDFDQYYQEYENGVEDVYYYYWRSQILLEYLDSSIGDEDFVSINKSLNEAIRKGRSFRNSEINEKLKETADQQAVLVDMNLSYQKWDNMMVQFNKLLDDKKTREALDLLEYHYKTEEHGEYDFFYYEKKYLATVVFITNTYDNSSSTFAKAYDTIKECYENMKKVENPSDSQREDIDTCRGWMQTLLIRKVQCKCDEYIEQRDFKSAEDIATKELKYSEPQEYRNTISRIKSLYLVSLVENKETSVDKIKKALSDAEEALSDATIHEADEATKCTRLETVSPRITKGREYLNSITTKASNVQSTKTNLSTPPSKENESEYIEELKACYEDGIITDKERRLLDRLRKSLGISEARAAELEAMCNPNTLSAEEQEYADEVKACLEDDGVITDKERRLLNKVAKSLGITQERANRIEKMVVK